MGENWASSYRVTVLSPLDRWHAALTLHLLQMLAPFICSRCRAHSRCSEDYPPTGTLTTQRISDVTHPTRFHRYETVAQTLLIIPTFNFVLGAPILMREIHEADDDVKVLAEDVAAAVSEKRHEVGKTST
jgi:hypothetical protein